MLEPRYNLSTRLLGTAFIWDHNFYDYSDLPDELGIKVISTPGHTPGSISLQIDGHLLTGDTLFCGGIGNTAFPGGDYITEVQSIKKLLELSPHLSVHPGHGGSTTIGDEKNTI